MKILLRITAIVFVITSIIYSQQLSINKNKNFAVIHAADSPEQIISKAASVVPTELQYRWQKDEFTAFIHFGVNTFTDKEWGDGTEDPKIFNPKELDANQWARTLKKAGVKTAILTAKHHDGFCLWPSKYTEHSVKNSPWHNGKGDVVKEFVTACRKAGLKVGLYLSPWDRNNPVYGDSPKYNEYYCKQLRELLTNYGEINEVWFDGACGEGTNGKKQVYDWPTFFKTVRELQPKAVMFGGPDLRWVGTETGYGRDTEWSVVPIDLSKMNSETKIASLDSVFLPQDLIGADLGSREKIFKANGLFWYPAEIDVSIRPGWFYHAAEDEKVKTPEKLTDIYFNSVGKNGVLLLNVPPNKDGLFSSSDIKSLTGFRKLIDKTFKTNFAANAKVKSAGMEKVFSASLLGSNTYWTTSSGVDTAQIEFILPAQKTFDVVMLQEEIRVGQRIEKFHLEYWTGTEWKKLVEGTTVGYKRLLKFDPIKTDRVKLVIEKSRLNPTLSNFGLFKLAK